MSRFAPARPRTAALLLASAGAALAPTAHAGATTTNWAAPVSGNFYDPANWTGGVGPTLGADIVIDATGQPYTVEWVVLFDSPRVNSLLLDSDDARLRLQGNSWFSNRDFRVSGDTVIRRGTFELTGQLFSTGALRIESGGTLDVVEGPSGSGFRGAQLALDVFNEGDFIVRGGATLTQIRGGVSLPSGIRIVNQQSGTMRFEGGNIFTGGVLDNQGLIILENDPQFDGTPPLEPVGTVFGPYDFRPTSFNNHGTVRVDQGLFTLTSGGIHSGTFELASPDATMILRGVQAFLPSARITGPGLIQVEPGAAISGQLNVDGNLLYHSSAGEIAPALNVAGTLVSTGSTVNYRSSVTAGLITGSSAQVHRFHAVADIAFDDAIGSAEFFAPAIIRSDLVSLDDRSVFHQYAEITGSVGNATFVREAFIGGNASNVEFNLGASMGGDLTGGATALGRVNVQGDVIATTGAWSFTGDGAVDALLDVTGDITITRPFEIRGDIIAQGDFSALQGRFANITADTVRFGASAASTHGEVSIFGNSLVTTGGDRAIINRARISSDFNQAPIGSENVTFVNGFEVIYNPVTQFTRSGFSVVVNADTMRETTFRFLADSILAGTLDVAVIGDHSNLSYGDSFTILDGRLLGGADPVATITGQFDRLFLPSLSEGLFFDVVYEPSAVRLVVVPAPGALSLFALAGLAIARRRRASLNA